MTDLLLDKEPGFAWEYIRGQTWVLDHHEEGCAMARIYRKDLPCQSRSVNASVIDVGKSMPAPVKTDTGDLRRPIGKRTYRSKLGVGSAW